MTTPWAPACSTFLRASARAAGLVQVPYSMSRRSAAIQACTQAGRGGLSGGRPRATAISDGGTIPRLPCVIADRSSAWLVQSPFTHIVWSM